LFRGILAAAVVLVLAVGCADRTKEELFNHGVESLNANNPRGAIVLFKNALEKDQNFFEARFQLARAYHRIGSLNRAEKELQKVILQHPAFEEAQIELARVLLHKGDPDRALKQIEELMEDSANPDVFEIGGMAYAIKEDYPAALGLLKKALSMNNGKAETGVAMAKVYLRTSRYDEARRHVEDVLRKEPAHSDALYVLAQIQLDQDDMDGAIETYGRIVKGHPSDTLAWFRKGVLYLKTGKNDEAMSISGRLMKEFPKRPEGYRLRGIALFYKMDFDGAIVALQKSLAIEDNSASHYFLGLSHYYEDEPEQALGHFQRVLDFEPAQMQSRTMVALILLKQDRTDDAIIEIKRALEIDENNAFAYNVLGSAYMAKGMYEEGLEALNKAIELDPGLVVAHIKKGLFSLSTGKLKQAETELTTAVKIAPEVLNSRVILASYYIKNKKYERAVKVLKEGIKGQSTDAVFYSLAAEAFLLDNKVPEAIAYLYKAKEANPDYFISYFNLAALHLLRGEMVKATEELKEVIERAPGNVRALISLAAMLEIQDRDQEAFKYYSRARATGGVEGLMALAKYLVREGRAETALGILDEFINKNPTQVAPYELKGSILLSQHKLKEAVRTYDAMRRINPQLSFAHTVKAYIEMKEPDRALRLVRQALRLNPGNIELMTMVSSIQMIMGQKQSAIGSAKQVIKEYPESPEGYLALSRVYQESKEMDRAIKVANQASALPAKSVEPYMMLGDLYASMGQYESALASYRKADSMKTGYMPAVYRQGAVLHAMDRKEEAAAEYLRVLRLSMNHVPALNNLAFLYAEDGQHVAKALQLATRAYILAPRNGLVVDTLGYVLLKNKNTEEAMKVLKKALELVPDNPSIYYHFALACAENGEKARALENLRRALALGEFPEEAKAKRLMVKLQKG
jgi:putative PEP-CTERM system TPR-repeat lipoprotein